MDNETAINIATMQFGDKVSRFLQAKYYESILDALQQAAARIGCRFAQTDNADFLSHDVYEYFSLAVAFAREKYLTPKEDTRVLLRAAKARLADGYAEVLVREIVSALDALGLKPQVRKEGIDWIEMYNLRAKLEADGDMDPVEGLGTPTDSLATAAAVSSFFDSMSNTENRP